MLIHKICEHVNGYNFETNILLFIVYRGNVLRMDTELTIDSAFKDDKFPLINVIINERSLDDIIFVPFIEFIPTTPDRN